MKYLPLLFILIAMPVFGQDDCISNWNCPEGYLIGNSWADDRATTEKTHPFNGEDVKKALGLALKYLEDKSRRGLTPDDLFFIQYLIFEHDPEKLKQIAKEYEQRHKDLEFIKKIYEDNF